jgi:hypothetical protein
MFCQGPLNSSSPEAPSYPTSPFIRQNSSEFQDVDLGHESCAVTIPEPNSSERPALLRRLMKALFSAKLGWCCTQNSPGRQDLEINGKDTPEPNSRDSPALLRRLKKALFSAKLRWCCTQNSPGRQDLEINGKDTPEPSFKGMSARPYFYQRLLNEPFSTMLRRLYGTTNHNSSQLHDLELGRNTDPSRP